MFAQDEFHYVTIIPLAQSGIATEQRILPTTPDIMGCAETVAQIRHPEGNTKAIMNLNVHTQHIKRGVR